MSRSIVRPSVPRREQDVGSAPIAPSVLRRIATLSLRSVGLVYLAYPFLVHWALAAGRPRLAALLTTVALAGLCAWLPRGRWRAVGIGAVALLVLVLLMYPDALPLVFLPPTAINAGFAIVFARTLLPGHEPLIARLARIERGRLPPDIEAYTRSLTWLWVVFFMAMAGISGVLAAVSLHAAWVWFTSIGNYVCVAALFVGEYVYRRRRFAQHRHLSPLRMWKLVRTELQRPA